MADVPNPMTPGTPTNPMTPGNSMGQARQPQARSSSLLTPGLVTFAAVMMFLLGGFQLTWAIVEFANASWIAANIYGSFGGYLWLWGILDVIFALAAFYAGYDLLRGGRFGQVFGLMVAGLSAIRWFFYLPAAPWVGIVMIAIDVLIIYGLVAHAEYFSTRVQRPV
jgi:hypothetical protein